MTADRTNHLGETGPAAADGSVRLTWTDPVTRDRICVELCGTEGFLRELLELGFEIAPDAGADPGVADHDPSAGGRRANARAHSTRSCADGRAGDAA